MLDRIVLLKYLKI